MTRALPRCSSQTAAGQSSATEQRGTERERTRLSVTLTSYRLTYSHQLRRASGLSAGSLLHVYWQAETERAC